MTVAPNPNGFPIAITSSPILNLFELPTLTTFNDSSVEIFNKAKSVLESVPITLASYRFPLFSTTEISFAFSIT